MRQRSMSGMVVGMSEAGWITWADWCQHQGYTPGSELCYQKIYDHACQRALSDQATERNDLEQAPAGEPPSLERE